MRHHDVEIIGMQQKKEAEYVVRARCCHARRRGSLPSARWPAAVRRRGKIIIDAATGEWFMFETEDVTVTMNKEHVYENRYLQRKQRQQALAVPLALVGRPQARCGRHPENQGARREVPEASIRIAGLPCRALLS